MLTHNITINILNNIKNERYAMITMILHS